MKQIVKRAINSIRYRSPIMAFREIMFMHGKSRLEKIGETTDKGIILTVAFNNEKTICYQAKTLAHFFRNQYQHIVIDNSNDENKSLEIQRECDKCESWYIRLPRNPWTGKNNSASHGIALNYFWKTYKYVYENISWVGFLDHDIYLIKGFEIEKILADKDMYGKYSMHNNRLYCWPGLVFCSNRYLKGKKANFKPGHGVDTGGNFFEIYDENTVEFPEVDKYEVRIDNNTAGFCQIWGGAGCMSEHFPIGVAAA